MCPMSYRERQPWETDDEENEYDSEDEEYDSEEEFDSDQEMKEVIEGNTLDHRS